MDGTPPQTPLGDLTTLPLTPIRLGRGTPPHHSPHPSTPLASRSRRLRRLASRCLRRLDVCPPFSKSWIRPCLHSYYIIIFNQNHKKRDHLRAFKCTKSLGRRGSASDSAGGAYSAPPDPLAGFRMRGKWGKKEGE